jgi:hypothetical protein
MSNGSVLVDGGDPTITFTEGTIVNNNGHILQVNDTTGGSVTLTALPSQPFTENGDGVLVTAATGDVTITNQIPGTIAINIASQQDGIKVTDSPGVQTFNGVNITAAGGAGFAGVNLQNNAGSTNFNNLTLALTSGSNASPGFVASNVNVVTVTGNSNVNVQNAPALTMTKVAAADMTFGTVASTASPTSGVLLDDVAGDIAITSSLTITDAVQDGLIIRNSPDLTFSSPSTVVNSTTGDAVVLQNNSIDATKVSLGQLTAKTAAGTGLVVTDAGVTTTGGTIDATGGASIAANNADLAVTLASASSLNSSGPGLDLTESKGSVEIAQTTVTSPAGNGINAVDNVPGFTATFGNTTVSGITNGAIGVNITNAVAPAPTTLYSFDSLDITTLTGTGLLTRNGGTVNFNSPAKIDASGGAAIDLENTLGTTGGVAGSGFTFLDLASTNSVASGVRLNNLNSDLQVTGNTEIAGAAGVSLSITDTVAPPATDSIRFNNVDITSRSNIGMLVDGIYGQVQVANLNIDNANNVAGDAVLIRNTTNSADPTGTGSGRVYINGGTIDGSNGNGVEVVNALARITGVTISGATGQSILATAGANQQTTLEVSNSTITAAAGLDGVRIQATGGGIVNATVATTLINATANSLNAIVFDPTSVISLNATSNFGAGGGAPGTGGFILNNQGGTLQIDQASTANLSTDNNGVTVTAPASPITFGGTTPPVPPPTP